MRSFGSFTAILLCVGAFSAAPPRASATERCVEYGAATLAGILVRQTYPGPPEYESFTNGDEPQVIWVLQLDTPTCVARAGSGYPGEYNAREVQLIFPLELSADHRRLLGKRVLATGALIPGGAKHDKRLVLEVASLRRTDVRPQ